MQRLAGKRIIVTGAAQGLGRAFTLHLVEQGARVLALDAQQSPLAALAATSPSITPICADVSSEEFAGEAARRAQTLWGGLDGLVNNAAASRQVAKRTRLNMLLSSQINGTFTVLRNHKYTT